MDGVIGDPAPVVPGQWIDDSRWNGAFIGAGVTSAVLFIDIARGCGTGPGQVQCTMGETLKEAWRAALFGAAIGAVVDAAIPTRSPGRRRIDTGHVAPPLALVQCALLDAPRPSRKGRQPSRDTRAKVGEPGWNRTIDQQIKSRIEQQATPDQANVYRPGLVQVGSKKSPFMRKYSHIFAHGLRRRSGVELFTGSRPQRIFLRPRSRSLE